MVETAYWPDDMPRTLSWQLPRRVELAKLAIGSNRDHDMEPAENHVMRARQEHADATALRAGDVGRRRPDHLSRFLGHASFLIETPGGITTVIVLPGGH
ncbi:MAG TPA: hypothetical protein VD978_12900 [Azospirillum sp.]|nr:hypothetical protein [Azospirillum sp.]